jgi:putative transcriptional regulator
MAITKMTADAIKGRPSRRDRAKIEATTEDDIRRQTIEDGEDPDEGVSESDIISPWYIRKKLGMSQREFANTLGVPVATLRNWEQNRVAMEPATVALMRILARERYQLHMRIAARRRVWVIPPRRPPPGGPRGRNRDAQDCESSPSVTPGEG